ncbi:glycosyltransferase family 2 protein [Maribacter sp. ANRC-HE7]|uniref:Glycosyltransferase family 2 protein n=1 Tax=Maribacter aquimaris TaxID=2737171 RepID=A0ABR7V2R5_9FLAO|nr:glycosyltransferase family A protein [Maribacter aquimaris]MBD0778219.1 glycosyltransferase family 2 protein [Maribacter aquimaris]
MKYYIVIPAHNEEAFLEETLRSLSVQTLQPKKVIIVNDNSSDGTEKIIDTFCNKYNTYLKLNTSSSKEHLPGSKVINAFRKGLALLDDEYDFIVKLDADLILPKNYFETIASVFNENKNIGLAGGFVYELDSNNEWTLNHPMNKKHVRGAFKAYSKACFKSIDGLRNAMGWDTVDELLAQYHGFEIKTLDELRVKHLRPTGKAYNAKAKLMQGEAMYAMDYGFLLTSIASLKMALKQKNTKTFYHNMKGFFKAKANKLQKMVSPEEGKFIRKLRWKGIKGKIIA